MKSAMLAAQTAFDQLQNNPAGELDAYPEALKNSWVYKELYAVRNIRPGFHWGLLPGLIYAALMVVAATADPFVGLFGMVLFVVGTLPALWLAGLGMELLSRRWRDEVRQIGRVVMAMNGVALVAIAGKLVM